MKMLLFAVLLLVSLILVPNVYATDDVDLDEFDDYLAEKLNIALFPAQLLASAIILAVCLFPTLLLTRNILAHLMMGLIAMGICIALGFLPYWLLLIICMITALMFSGKIRDWVSGGSRGG